MTDQRGTTFSQDWNRVTESFRDMFPQRFNQTILWQFPWTKGYVKRTRIGDFGHALMNVATEGVRRNAQFVAKVLVFGPIVWAILYFWQ